MPVPRNLPKSPLNLPNRHKNLIRQNRPKKPNFIWPFFRHKKAKGIEKRPKITNLASKKPNWQPCR